MLILLLANILRIYYWIGKKFSTILLIQSILMIITQLYLLYVSIIYSKEFLLLSKKHKEKNQKTVSFKLTPPSFSNILNNFWKWNYYSDYLYFLIITILTLTVLTNIFGNNNLAYYESLGALSAAVEALIGVPQFVSNFKNKSTGSLSVGMILSWFFGDAFKTFYFISNNQPIQFICCGIFQLLVDILIIMQIIYYGNNNVLNTTLNTSINSSDDSIDNKICG